MRLLKIMLLLLAVTAGVAVLAYEEGKKAAETMDFMLLLTCFISQILFVIGMILLVAMLISLAHTTVARIAGRGAQTVYSVTGFVGTPVHELSHALMCIVFGHKIREMRLYQPKAEDGVLGYVKHSYSKTSIYQQIGNFFIGVAPILIGSALLMLLMRWLVPDIFSSVTQDMRSAGNLLMRGANGSTVATYFALLGKFFWRVFALKNFGNILWWVFLILAMMISMHMKLSRADIKGGFVGFLFLAGAILLMDFILCMVSSSALQTVTTAMIFGSASLLGFLLVSLVFSGVSVGVAFALSTVAGIIRRVF